MGISPTLENLSLIIRPNCDRLFDQIELLIELAAFLEKLGGGGGLMRDTMFVDTVELTFFAPNVNIDCSFW
ncbi:MAG: hypothetical protein EAZ78_05770 [Oscillatoriales cyanobacterium]|nr:MAG: hypothetical protein EAZ78_05770 [Oscillatoriales cyanobacterium]TAF63495.1 MAG: hypothetical protein EAZ59_20645 [Oscillatoriales cyanobacterium]